MALWLPPSGQRAVHYLGSHAFSFPLLILLRFLSGALGGGGFLPPWAPPASLMGSGSQTRRAREAGEGVLSMSYKAGGLGVPPVALGSSLRTSPVKLASLEKRRCAKNLPQFLLPFFFF